jgi:hypothetical protein
MANKGTGRWVARAGATGGGRTYRGQAPTRWYMSLALICLLGVSLVVYSRYERQHPVGTVQPAVGTHWYAALAFDVCGNLQANLPTTPATKATPGIKTDGDGVIRVEPTTKVDAGANATLGRFVQSYPGLELTSSALKLPGKSTYHNGDTCPAGTPDAHKRADVRVQVWSSFSGAGSNHPVTVSDPSSLKLANDQLITVAFVPPGASIKKPSAETIVTMLDLISPPTTTTTTAPSTSITSTPSVSTTVPSTTTTKP